MKAIEIKKGIYWVGAIDWDLRNFHGYSTQRGSTYNAYLIMDEKITLIDTVKNHLKDEMMERISSVVDPSKIDYVISNHVEMDHSGALPAIMDAAQDAVIFCSANGQRGLKAHYKKEWNFRTVKTGDVVSLGKRSIQFILTPMVHWPDNMIGYVPEEKILFSNDSFGQHYASSERFDDECDLGIVMEEAAKYYANIVLPYSSQVQKELNEAKDLDIQIIAPSHGIIWREHVSEIVNEYIKWANNTTEKKALVIYDTMWGSTQKIAYTIQDVFERKGYSVKVFNLQHNHISDIMTEVLTAEYVCVGSPTLNSNIMADVAAFLTYLKGLAPKDRKAIVFGSYGWGGQSAAILEKNMDEAKFEVVSNIKVRYIPDDNQLMDIKQELEKSI